MIGRCDANFRLCVVGLLMPGDAAMKLALRLADPLPIGFKANVGGARRTGGGEREHDGGTKQQVFHPKSPMDRRQPNSANGAWLGPCGNDPRTRRNLGVLNLLRPAGDADGEMGTQ